MIREINIIKAKLIQGRIHSDCKNLQKQWILQFIQITFVAKNSELFQFMIIWQSHKSIFFVCHFDQLIVVK